MNDQTKTEQTIVTENLGFDFKRYVENTYPSEVINLTHRDSDGYFAAFCSRRWHANAMPGVPITYVDVQYGEPMPIDIDKLTGKEHVYIMDFSYEREILEALYAKLKDHGKLVVLDHHKTAMNRLDGLEYAHFNMEKSGALLAWEYFFWRADVPDICKYVNDRDLWKWEYREKSEPISAWLDLKHPGFDFKVWEQLMDPVFLERAIGEGQVILDYQKAIVKRHLKSEKPEWKELTLVALLNDQRIEKKVRFYASKGILQSELGQAHYQSQDNTISLEYRVIDENMVFSLRSGTGANCDVGALAEALVGPKNGGGHPAAAGFHMPLAQGIRFVSYVYEGILQGAPVQYLSDWRKNIQSTLMIGNDYSGSEEENEGE